MLSQRFSKRLRTYYRWRFHSILKRTARIVDKTLYIITPFTGNSADRANLQSGVASIIKQQLCGWRVILLVVCPHGTDINDLPLVPDWLEIKVIEQKTGKTSVASLRNFGMSIVESGWIMFVDCENRLAENALQMITESISANCGVLLFRVFDAVKDKTKPALESTSPRIGDIDSMGIVINADLKKQTLWQPKQESEYFFFQNVSSMSTHYGYQNLFLQQVIGSRVDSDKLSIDQ
ncbi:MAG: glycosyltransferase family 2 protein [bacterium]|nr:glycosyltransferase family 2 protein [bacterium]